MQVSMPNNPIHPEPEKKAVTEVPTSANSFTDGLRGNTLPDAPEVIANVAAESTGKKLTREQQMEFINNLPDDLMLEFAQRVKAHIQQDAEQTKKRKAPEYISDFSTIQEQSIFDLNIPIQAIDQQIPEYLNIKLRDKNFEPRWIQTSSKRLGQARSQGWAYITAEDLEEELNIEIEPDSSGHFIYIDTVAMKIPKSKLYAQLRSNYLRAIALTQQAQLHEKMKHTIEAEIENATDPHTGMPLRESYLKYKESGAMSTYSPLSK